MTPLPPKTPAKAAQPVTPKAGKKSPKAKKKGSKVITPPGKKAKPQTSKEKKAEAKAKIEPLERKKLEGAGPMQRFAAAMAADKGAGFRIVKLSDPDALTNVRTWISTRSLALDRLLKTPGFPCGRVVEILGDPGVGKTATLDGLFSSVLAMGGHAICQDVESSRDAKHGQTRYIIGDASRLHLQELDSRTIEDAFKAIHETVKWWVTNEKTLPVLIGIDSIGSLTTTSGLARMEAGEEGKPMDAAKAIKQGLRVTTSLLSGSNVCVVFVNHEYQTMPKGGFPSSKKPYGGSGLDYHSSMILKLHRRSPILDAGAVIRGHEVEIEVQKTRLSDSTGYRTKVAMIKGVGIDNTWTVFEDLKARGLITGAGWYDFSPPGHPGARWQGAGSFGFARMISERPELWPVAVDLWRATT